MGENVARKILPDYGFINSSLLNRVPDRSENKAYTEFQKIQTEFQLFLTTARLSAANEEKGMPSFYTGYAESVAKDLANLYFEKGEMPPFWLFPRTIT